MRKVVIGALVAMAIGLGVMTSPAGAHEGERTSDRDRCSHGERHDRRGDRHDGRGDRHDRDGRDGRDGRDNSDDSDDGTLSSEDQAFLTAAAQAAFAEIEQGRVATVRSDDEMVQDFGHDLIVDHFVQLVNQVPLHERFGVPIPGSTAEQVAASKALLDTSDDAFDEAFLMLQVTNHEKAVALFTAAAEDADNGTVRRFAEDNLPVLEEHLQHAQMLLEEEAPTKTILELGAEDPDFSTLVAAIKAAGLDETLAGEGPFTVFAPTNEAFDALPEGTLETLLADPKGALTQILKLHVISGSVDSEAAIAAAGGTVDTLGGPVSVKVADGELVIGGATVVTADIPASNGTIHVIDAVITEPATAESAA